MSIYDSSRPSAGDSGITTRAKTRLKRIVSEEFKKRGYKTTIHFECPATFDKKYHGDLGVLFRSVKDFDTYHFFIIEIDDPSHDTFRHENKDWQRDIDFRKHGIITIRIKLSKIQGANKVENDEELFNDQIWFHINTEYLEPRTETDRKLSEKNRLFSIELKENGKGTKCEGCDHGLYQHDICGCDWKHTNKSKLRCNCTKPHFRSDE